MLNTDDKMSYHHHVNIEIRDKHKVTLNTEHKMSYRRLVRKIEGFSEDVRFKSFENTTSKSLKIG